MARNKKRLEIISVPPETMSVPPRNTAKLVSFQNKGLWEPEKNSTFALDFSRFTNAPLKTLIILLCEPTNN